MSWETYSNTHQTSQDCLILFPLHRNLEYKSVYNEHGFYVQPAPGLPLENGFIALGFCRMSFQIISVQIDPLSFVSLRNQDGLHSPKVHHKPEHDRRYWFASLIFPVLSETLVKNCYILEISISFGRCWGNFQQT